MVAPVTNNPSRMTRPLFVYGTLQDADVLALVLGRPLPRAAMRPASAPGHDVVHYPGRTYPALRRAPGQTAAGLLLENLGAGDLALLDAFEGEEYRRTPLEVHAAGATVAAEAYSPAIEVPANALPWSLADWTGRHKGAFLAVEALNLADLRRRLTELRPVGADEAP